MEAPAGAVAATGAITGVVDDAATGAAVPGVCVYAYPQWNDAPDPDVTPYGATTAGDGSYEMQVGANAADYVVRFDPSCDGTKSSPYAAQYFVGQLDFSSANAVDVSGSATGVDAHLVPGFSISGTVSAPGDATGPAGVCVSADDPAGNAVISAKTAADGTYQIGNLPAGTYSVNFDPTCDRAHASTYAPQAQTVDFRADTTGVDAQLVVGATVSGKVTAAPGAANYGGICAYAIGPSGAVSEEAVTSPSGTYRLADLAPQAYTIKFDPTCSGSQSSSFGKQTYPGRVQVGPGDAIGGVDAVLALSGHPLAIAPVSLYDGQVQSSLYEGQVYQPYYQGLSLNNTYLNGIPWQVTGLPRGLSTQQPPAGEDAAIEGDITGIPQVAGTFTVTVTVTSYTNVITGGLSVPPLVATKTFKLVVLPAAPVVTILPWAAQVSGKSVPVGLFCTYLTCSGNAKLTTKGGVVLANTPYSLEKSTSRLVKLALTSAGSEALAKARQYPVNEDLVVSVRGGKEVTRTIRVS